MSTLNYNIAQTNLRPNFKLSIFSFLSSIAIILKIKALKRALVKNVNSDFTEIDKRLAALSEKAKIVSRAKAVEVYPDVKNLLFAYRRMIARFEKNSFFNSPTMQRLSESILDSLYSMESSLRIAAFDDIQQNREDEKELVEFASRVSLRSLQDQ
jgi:hypothetical protein